MKAGPLEVDEEELCRLRQLAKREIRARMRAVRRVLPLEVVAERSERACRRVLELPEFERARTVIAYAAMRKELDPRGVLEEAWRRGKRVGLPRIEGDALVLHVHEAGAPLIENAFGVEEPAEDAEIIAPLTVDLILVPALAIDPRGHRIGYGGGFYDRLLPTVSAAHAVGIVYDFQLVSETPSSALDVPVSRVVTDARVLELTA